MKIPQALITFEMEEHWRRQLRLAEPPASPRVETLFGWIRLRYVEGWQDGYQAGMKMARRMARAQKARKTAGAAKGQA